MMISFLIAPLIGLFYFIMTSFYLLINSVDDSIIITQSDIENLIINTTITFLLMMTIYFFKRIKNWIFSLFYSSDDNNNKLVDMIKEVEEKNNSKILFVVDNFWNINKHKLPKEIRKRVIEIDEADDDDFLNWFHRGYNWYNSDEESESESECEAGSWSDSDSSEEQEQEQEQEHDQEHNKEYNLQLILHTTGGSISTSDMISNILLRYKGRVKAYIPYYSFSAGTFVALSSDEIYMNDFAHLGPVDPQLNYKVDNNTEAMCSTRNLISICNDKNYDKISDSMMLKINSAKILHQDSMRNLENILEKKGLNEEVISIIKKELGSGDNPHFKPFDRDSLRSMGLEIKGSPPRDIYKIFREFLKMKKTFVVSLGE